MMKSKWPIWAAAALLPIAAAAQPAKIQDRHPAYANDPVGNDRLVRVEEIHSFEQRWEPVRSLLAYQRMLGLAPENAPVATPAPLRTPPRAKVADRAKAGDVCTRHGMTKHYISRYHWRCRR